MAIDSKPTGANIIAGEPRSGGAQTFSATNPRTGRPHAVAFHEATPEEVDDAVTAAAAAFEVAQTYTPKRLSVVLHAVAEQLERTGDEVVAVADAETALGRPRLEGEFARTCDQFRQFAALLDDGWYVAATIDTAISADQGTPRPDLRRMLVPIGPVAVFGAGNFPLALSTPGGDTASALAAACPVVVKGHPSHPGTSELCGRAIAAALAASDAPSGLFSLLQGQTADVGRALVTAPQVRAVAFTGSQQGGRTLYDLAAARPEPIPVYAEMGSLNPIFLSPAALKERGSIIAEDLLASITNGTGQFCTKPGMALVVDDPIGDNFVQTIGRLAQERQAGIMLNERLRDALAAQVEATAAMPGVQLIAGGPSDQEDGFAYSPTVFVTSADTLLMSPDLTREHFGPVCVVVRCASTNQMRDMARELPGSLTATVHAQEEEADWARDVLSKLREKAGRVIWNGYPTGAPPSHAMHHGGPYPATTFPAHTSVGTAAIHRFLRPVAYQNIPDQLLPPALQDANPLKLLRLVDGRWTDAPVEEADP